MSLFANKPIAVREGIPVFSEESRYTRNYDRIAADHLAAMKKGIENPFMDAAAWRDLELSTIGLIRKHALPGQTILDAGVGLGRLLKEFPDLDRHGCDIALQYLLIAREVGIDVALALAEELPYKADAFDIVVTTDVLEHALNLHAASDQLVRVLKPGGMLIVRVPFMERLDAYVSDKRYDFVHLRSFDLSSLRLHFEKIFELKYVEHTFSKPTFGTANSPKCRLLDDPRTPRTIILGMDRAAPYWAALAAASAVSHSQLVKSLVDLRTAEPQKFEELVEVLCRPSTISVAFRKPA